MRFNKEKLPVGWTFMSTGLVFNSKPYGRLITLYPRASKFSLPISLNLRFDPVDMNVHPTDIR